jgi:5-bromo-4-chloroindolyl phosphate hydrolysis protein
VIKAGVLRKKCGIMELKSIASINDEINNYLMEIEAKDRLIKYQKAYKITDYEIDVLKETLNEYKIKLENLKKGGA